MIFSDYVDNNCPSFYCLKFLLQLLLTKIKKIQILFESNSSHNQQFFTQSLTGHHYWVYHRVLLKLFSKQTLSFEYFDSVDEIIIINNHFHCQLAWTTLLARWQGRGMMPASYKRSNRKLDEYAQSLYSTSTSATVAI